MANKDYIYYYYYPYYYEKVSNLHLVDVINTGVFLWSQGSTV